MTSTTITTPGGQCPLAGSTWLVTPNVTTTSGIPTWAIVMCILTIWLCLLGLLFLLAKEQRTTGHVQVAVQSDGFYFATQIPISHPGQVTYIEQQVNQVRSMAAQAGPGPISRF